MIKQRAGTYHVEQSAKNAIRLVADPPQPALEILATASTHEETVALPLALAIAEEGQEDEVHLVLLLPDGQGLDAGGTFSGTRSRGSRVHASTGVGWGNLKPCVLRGTGVIYAVTKEGAVKWFPTQDF